MFMYVNIYMYIKEYSLDYACAAYAHMYICIYVYAYSSTAQMRQKISKMPVVGD